MDARIAWLQPPQFGPATALWQQIAENASRVDDENTNNLENNGITNGPPQFDPSHIPKPRIKQQPSPEGFQDMLLEKRKHLNLLGIKDVSPLSRGIQARNNENAAGTTEFNYNELERNQAQNGQWRPKYRTKYPSGVHGLHHEIKDFYEWISPTAEEYLMRYEIVNRVENVIKHVFPNVTVEVFGSFQTGLYLPTSDVDMVVLNLEHAALKENPLFKLEKALVEHGVAEQLSIKVIPSAQVPIVKMRDMVTDVKVDISFNMSTGVESVSLIKEFIREFPALPPLVLLLKQFLLQRDMNEVWTGGISSYGLILMTVSFLQHQPEHTDPSKDLGRLLIDFFELYGTKFNYNKCCIRVKNGGSYIKKEEMQQQMIGGIPSVLSIEDPLTPSNDIGKSSYGAPQVKAAFEYAHRVLSRAITPQAQYHTNDSILSKLILVTEQVSEYRKWIKDNWAQRVPRLSPERPTSIQLPSKPKASSLENTPNPTESESIVSSSSGESDNEPNFEQDSRASIDANQETEQPDLEDSVEGSVSSRTADKEKYDREVREWDKGKNDYWDDDNRMIKDTSRDYDNENDFPPLNTSKERSNRRDRRDRQRNSHDHLSDTRMSDKESIASQSDISDHRPPKRAIHKPTVNFNSNLFKNAIGTIGHKESRLTGAKERTGKRPERAMYVPKGSSTSKPSELGPRATERNARKSPRDRESGRGSRNSRRSGHENERGFRRSGGLRTDGAFNDAHDDLSQRSFDDEVSMDDRSPSQASDITFSKTTRHISEVKGNRKSRIKIELNDSMTRRVRQRDSN